MVSFKFATILLCGLNLGIRKAYFVLRPSHAEDTFLLAVVLPSLPTWLLAAPTYSEKYSRHNGCLWSILRV